ncbi:MULTISPECIES: hypothetical protein [unclassified Chromobacterium]|uniref:hypothetical protein n=1 Tax=unclassified Chromobacterium TaxID=2641838 RepID=UPI001F42B151|nr:MULTISPECIES: hypothetical protein [unclassified Chromobacterium]MCP1293038.1 hypothetical protein [Chromobacterium sp. S0633]UJB32229.1 hypothetical protein HQN78_14875 [Chromobacterium sp. Beijing]
MLNNKLIEHRARLALKRLSGLFSGAVMPIQADDYAKNRAFLRQHCHLDAEPQQKLAAADESETLQALTLIFARHASTVTLPFEQPYCIQADISDVQSFVKSVWSANDTQDLTVFFDTEGATLDLQDREDGLYLFYHPGTEEIP